MLRFIGFLVLLAAATASTPEVRAQERLAMSSDAEPKVFAVRMVDKSPTEFVFEPSVITVSPGYIVRFVQSGIQPHNVEFREGPAPTIPGAPKMGPFLIARGATYDIVIGDDVATGTYEFVCTPHQALGMTGTLIVVGVDENGGVDESGRR